MDALCAHQQFAPRLGLRRALHQAIEVVVAAVRDRRDADDEAGAGEHGDRPLEPRIPGGRRPHPSQQRPQNDEEREQDTQSLEAEVEEAVNQHRRDAGDQRGLSDVAPAPTRDLDDQRAESSHDGNEKQPPAIDEHLQGLAFDERKTLRRRGVQGSIDRIDAIERPPADAEAGAHG